MNPTTGRIVHFCISNCATIWVPLLVVRVEGDRIAGQLFVSPEDQLNVDALPKGQTAVKLDKGRWWVEGGVEGDSFGCWRWPPRAESSAGFAPASATIPEGK